MYEMKGVPMGVAKDKLTPERRQQIIDAYVALGRNFESWEVWTALETFVQLQEAADFDVSGWAFYTTIFAQYREWAQSSASEDLPSTDAERVDEWVRRTSAVAGRNLWPFYEAWGFSQAVGVTQATIDEVSRLPTWVGNPMPPSSSGGRGRMATSKERTALTAASPRSEQASRQVEVD
jgi:hypothetical protein